MKIGIVTLGCDKNTVDNEYMAGMLEASGVEVMAADREPDGNLLDAVLINTCGFVESAKSESINSILSWVEHKKERAEVGERVRVFVAGCLTQRYRESLISELPEVDGFLGVGEFDKVVKLVNSPAETASSINLIRELPTVQVQSALPRKQLGPASGVGYLKIADGCNHNCSFCAIPSFKGRLQSVPKDVLLAEARLLLSRGVREINIVAQDTSDYGKDIYGKSYGIAELLSDLSRISGDFWIRLFYFYPGGLTYRFLEAFATSHKVAKYIDMPLQHLHPEVLRNMKRPHNEVNTVDAIARLRKAVPDITLRTTFITGFPGETEEQFEYLLKQAGELKFDRMGAFPFSIEEGTPSSTMAEQIPKRVRKSRHSRLMKMQSKVCAELNRQKIGCEMRVLVEGKIDDSTFLARSQADAPDVDGTVLINSECDLALRDFVTVKITGADTYDLRAVPA